MNDDYLATTSGKSTATAVGGSSPFDQIASLEAQEQVRVQKELDAMAAEEQQVKQALQDKEAQAELDMKEAARKELVEYRENELQNIVKAAEADGQKESKALESAYAAKESESLAEITAQFLTINQDKPA